jgi:hypothetical protein
MRGGQFSGVAGGAIVVAMFLQGCAASSTQPAVNTTGHAASSAETQSEITSLKESLKAAQDEIKWLHLHLAKRPGFAQPIDVINTYAAALIERNGAVARVYLSESMRQKLNMPPHGIGTSNPHLKRFEVLAGKGANDGVYKFDVRFFSEYTGEPETAEPVQTYTVRAVPDDTGNDAWIITDISS